jgi:Flp pilus assembly protein TadG
MMWNMPMTWNMPMARRQHGVVAVEFALLLPMLLMLLFGMMDAGRALQANIIITNISREGANLVARGTAPLETSSQDVIYALMASAPPLNVNQQGMIYITRVMGVVTAGVSRSVVLDQYRWDDAVRNLGFRVNGYQPDSKAYDCTAWDGSHCISVNSLLRPPSPIMNGTLQDGEVVYVVETFYRYDMLLSIKATAALDLPNLGPDLYSMTVF